MNLPSLSRIYPITDASISSLDNLRQIEEMIRGGATIIQLRDKRTPSDQLYEQAREAAAIASSAGAALIVNDRVDIAIAAGAAGVHLGQEDLPADRARKLLGEDAVIGVSTHNLEQAAAAARLPVDYIAIGPVFTTSTKADTDPVVGLEGVEQAREAAGGIPLVAIGGITLENYKSVLEAGADSVAVIGAVLTHPEGIKEAVAAFLK